MEQLAKLYKGLNNNAYAPVQHELWAMALSAPCYGNPKTSMELISGLSIFSWEKRRVYKKLVEEFGSAGPRLTQQGRNTLLYDVAEDILRNPAQAFYQHIRMRLILLGDDADKWIAKLADARIQKLASFVLSTLHLLPIAGIQAWNISRAIYFVRCGLLFGLEGCNTAMAKITRHARLAQILYSSWEEYFTAYAAGAKFVHPDVSMPEGLAEKLESIIGHIYGAGTDLPWDLKLGHSLFRA